MAARFVEDAASAVLDTARELLARGLVDVTSGNVSARRCDGALCITPTSLDCRVMTLDDLVVVDPSGQVVGGWRQPSSEMSLHLACYAAFPEVAGVVHSHALHASMFAVARQSVPAAVDELAMYAGGEIAVADYAPSGSVALGDAAVRCLADRGATLLANHGMVAVGRSPADALHITTVVERAARIVAGARALGRVVALPGPGEDALHAYRSARHG